MTNRDRPNFDQNLPLYLQVAHGLRRAIESGVYPVGSSLPTEAQLCTEFDISRHTARDALRLLEQAGYVSRRRGAGTYVEANRPKNKYVQSLASIDDLFRYAHETRFVIEQTRRTSAGHALAGFLGVAIGSRWLKLTGRRYQILNERPFALTELYLDRRFEGALPAIENHRGAICALLEELFPVRIARIGQDIQAVTLSEGDAARLQVKPGAAALRVVRRYLDRDGQLLELSSNVYPATRFTYNSWIDRDESL